MGAAALGEEWTLRNPLKTDFQDEPVRLHLKAPTEPFIVREDGKEVPCQIEEIDGQKYVWVAATVGPNEKRTYTIEPGAPAKGAPKVQVAKEGEAYVLDNGQVAVKVPASGSALVSPILAVRLPSGNWAGGGFWKTERKLIRLTSAIVGDGTVFGKVRLHYEFEGKAGLNGDVPAFATVDVSVQAGSRHATLEESHEMSRFDYWEFDCAKGWDARESVCVPISGGCGDRPDLKPWPPNSLRVGQTRMGDTLLRLQPRWSQSYDEGWFFGATEGQFLLGALPARAGKWLWPHSNLIDVKVKESADYAGLRCPTWKGRRYWFLLAGPKAELGGGWKAYAARYAMWPLDKLSSDFILDWEGQSGGFTGVDYLSEGINPTGGWRGKGRAAVAAAGKQGNLSTLTEAQAILHPDTYGSYWLFWSPENPNFFTDFVKPGIAYIAQLRTHPRFADLRRLAEQKFREDLYHSVTLPGGTGQECPGYLAHSMETWAQLAPICKEHMGVDPTAWPQFKAAASFLVHASQPIGGGQRRCHPGGDTHPPGPNVFEIAEKFGVREDVKSFKTEELPGFGVIFRNGPGTNDETYLAFKSGPNRGHYHGDQLSFHYCARSKPVAIDHMCSYAPRAGQEHMHNRVAFHTEKLPYANMNGYERVIAFKTSADREPPKGGTPNGGVDVAIGQVESERLRETTKVPPEKWDWYLPEERFDKPLRYRRTIVAVRSVAASGSLADRRADYFVIRDQHDGPRVKATWCLHVLSDAVERTGGKGRPATSPTPQGGGETKEPSSSRKGQRSNILKNVGMSARPQGVGETFDFRNLQVFVAAPSRYEFEPFDWSHERKDKKTGEVSFRESTKGIRLTVEGEQSEFITVLCPVRSAGFSPSLPVGSAGLSPYLRVSALPGGVQVGDDEILFAGGIDADPATAYVTVKRSGQLALTLTGKDIDLDRSQGDIGLFVPDAGYPFGEVPEWLCRQRLKKPEWYQPVWPLGIRR